MPIFRITGIHHHLRHPKREAINHDIKSNTHPAIG
jgi:hypothetical protein